MKSAEAGAISSASAPRVRSMCGMLLAMRASHWSVKTVCPDSAWKVTGVTKRVPASVIATCTSAPCLTSRRTSSADLYAAMPPVTPRTMRLPESSMCSIRWLRVAEKEGAACGREGRRAPGAAAGLG